VVFDGGNGEVSGITVDRQDVAGPLGPVVASEPTTAPASTGPSGGAAGAPTAPSPGGNAAPMAPRAQPAEPIVDEPDYTG
jgi:hypothetical protein